VRVPYEPTVQAEWARDEAAYGAYSGYSTRTTRFEMPRRAVGDDRAASFHAVAMDDLVFDTTTGYLTRAPKFEMPQRPLGDERACTGLELEALHFSPSCCSPSGRVPVARAAPLVPQSCWEESVARLVLRDAYRRVAEAATTAEACCVLPEGAALQVPQFAAHFRDRRGPVAPYLAGDYAGEFGVEGIGDFVAVPEAGSFGQWQIEDDLSSAGSAIAAGNYQLVVCLGDRIAEETVASRVHVSRLQTGPEWRDFLSRGCEGELCEDGLTLEDMLQCPCCLGILKRPVALPCGHSLCRGCLMRLQIMSSPDAPAGSRRCPLCRATVPRVRLHENTQLDVVTEALHVYIAHRSRGHGAVTATTAEEKRHF